MSNRMKLFWIGVGSATVLAPVIWVVTHYFFDPDLDWVLAGGFWLISVLLDIRGLLTD